MCEWPFLRAARLQTLFFGDTWQDGLADHLIGIARSLLFTS